MEAGCAVATVAASANAAISARAMLTPGAKIRFALPHHFLGQREAQAVAIERERALDVLHEEAHRPEAHDLERLRHQDPVDVVLRGWVDVAMAGNEVDALREGLLHLLEFGDLRK